MFYQHRKLDDTELHKEVEGQSALFLVTNQLLMATTDCKVLKLSGGSIFSGSYYSSIALIYMTSRYSLIQVELT